MNKEDKNMGIPPEILQNFMGNTPSQNPENISSNAVYQQPQNDAFVNNTQLASPDANTIKQIAANDIQRIRNLVNSGAVTSEQGQNLVNYVVQKAFDTTKMYMNKSQAQPPMQSQPQVNSYLDSLENPEFFAQDGRSQVLEYLKKSNADVGKDEMSQITNIITALEQAAVTKHLRLQDHEKTLNNENEAAKQRLRANAQKTSSGNSNGRVFTREQIGKMSGAEFAKNERFIMEQLRKGQIR